MNRQTIIRQLCDLGLAEMKPHGSWGLTREGRAFLDQLDMLKELDDRPAALRPSSPRRQARTGGSRRTVAPPVGTRRGDGPDERGAPGKNS